MEAGWAKSRAGAGLSPGPGQGRRCGYWGVPAPLTEASCACSRGPMPGQPGVPGVRRGLRQDLLQPTAHLLQLLHLRLLLSSR